MRSRKNRNLHFPERLSPVIAGAHALAPRSMETIMSDYDPNRLDPNRPDPREPRLNEAGGFSWNWIIGGIAAIVVVLVAIGFVGRGDRTAERAAPSETTGQASPPPAAAPAERMSPRPVTPNQ
jgi:hypothetical protein